MKRVSLLLAIALFVASLMTACDKGSVPTPSESTEAITTTEQTPPVEESDKSSTVIDRLDEEMKQAFFNDSTTASMVDISVEYRQKWQDVADEYYNKLMEYDGLVEYSEFSYSSEDFHTFLSSMKTNWEEYYNVECENYYGILQSIHGPGTIVPVLMSEHQCELTREWAIELIDIASLLGIE